MLSQDEPLVRQASIPRASPHYFPGWACWWRIHSQAGRDKLGTPWRSLFLDEINEHPSKVLEVLRQPIEDKICDDQPGKGQHHLPRQFLACRRSQPLPLWLLWRYAASLHAARQIRFSAIDREFQDPILDRIDIHVDVPRVDFDKLMGDARAESSQDIRQRVEGGTAVGRSDSVQRASRTSSPMPI